MLVELQRVESYGPMWNAYHVRAILPFAISCRAVKQVSQTSTYYHMSVPISNIEMKILSEPFQTCCVWLWDESAPIVVKGSHTEIVKLVNDAYRSADVIE